MRRIAAGNSTTERHTGQRRNSEAGSGSGFTSMILKSPRPDFPKFAGQTGAPKPPRRFDAGFALTKWIVIRMAKPAPIKRSRFFSRLRRAEIDIHHHVAGPYWSAYTSEMA